MEEEKSETDGYNHAGIFPRCPRCEKGVLLPFSFKEDVFEKWKCTDLECGFILKKHDRDR